ncbi:hypothetical protein [Streptomyces kanamyceticus]|uniref:Integral membrane protein n=1 Tax=Streptomyces kanamyceticus TaxID=1967 RepID=A0A5J6GFI4_STRKN|nr:hypothetical protein [Streptomyces kanamyceticus]QEU93873.1 hypothetical protein CP970_25860 [Streptomyces kanamyceticus]
MQGHGYAPPPPPPPPSGGSPVTLRVLFVALAVVSCGMLAWAALLRLALVTRKAYDWVLFGLVVALDVLALALVGIDKGVEDFEGPGNTGMVILLCTMLAVVAYYLYADIRHFSRYRQRPPTGYVPPQAQPGYGYPPPYQQAPAQAPAPARIHQVRAELDELSDYLRKQEGGS